MLSRTTKGMSEAESDEMAIVLFSNVLPTISAVALASASRIPNPPGPAPLCVGTTVFLMLLLRRIGYAASLRYMAMAWLASNPVSVISGRAPYIPTAPVSDGYQPLGL